MKVLLVHNYYSSRVPSGENSVFVAERELLRKHGCEVQVFTCSNDEIAERGIAGKMLGAICAPWNPKAARRLRRQLQSFKPDVVHIHNTFPLISPSIFYAIGKKAARVLTLHNYRIFCSAGIPMRDGNVCTECLSARSATPSIIHGCYRNSRLATLPVAANVALHRALGTWTNQVDAFICLSEFQRALMVQSGLPREKVYVKPNFYPGDPSVVPWADRQPYVVFAGRLTPEKGLISLLRAWQKWGVMAPELRLIGEGELRSELERMAGTLPVRFLGQLSADDTHSQIAHARLLILPSECFEGFPMVVREAFAFGTPTAVSDLGPLNSIVEHGKSGIVFRPSNPDSLLEAVHVAWRADGLLEELGRGAHREFQEKYTEDINYAILANIYRQALTSV